MKHYKTNCLQPLIKQHDLMLSIWRIDMYARQSLHPRRMMLGNMLLVKIPKSWW